MVAIGLCRLCLQKRELKSSHFMPAAMYKIALESDGEPPIILSKNKKIQTSKQAQALLLCGACEQRFTKSGEDWVFDRCWQANGAFPLRALVLKNPPAYSTPGFAIYDTAGVPGIDHAQVVYFAASIFWRASAHDWHLVETNSALDLGPYAEELRHYLLGEEFPKNVVLVVSISPENDFRAAAMSKFPYLKNHHKDYRQYDFLMNGLTFDLFVGSALSPAIRGMCFFRTANRPIFVADSMQQAAIQEFRKMDSTAKAYGKLARL